MTWLEKVSYEHVAQVSCWDKVWDEEEITIHKLNINNHKSHQISAIAQFFLAKEVFSGEKCLCNIPISNTQNYTQVLEEIAIHFNDVKEVKKDNKVFEIMLIDVKESSKMQMERLYKTNKISSIILDLFGSPLHINPNSQTVWYKVKLKHTKNDQKSINTFEPVWKFLVSSYSSKKPSLVLTPNSWLLSEKLQDSPALHFFHSKCKELFLAVDYSSNQVIGINLIFKFSV